MTDRITIGEAIATIDAIVPNTRTEDEKVQWLDTLDRMTKLDVFDTHEGCSDITFSGYDENTPLDTPLLIPKPYGTEIYKNYLELQIHLANKEFDRYNSASAQYSSHYDNFVKYWHCTHMPLQPNSIHF